MSKKNIKAEANEFDEAIEASKSFVEKNIKPLGYGIGAVLVVVIGILLVHQFYIVPNNKKADEALFAAQQQFMDGNYEKALNGEGDAMGWLLPTSLAAPRQATWPLCMPLCAMLRQRSTKRL